MNPETRALLDDLAWQIEYAGGAGYVFDSYIALEKHLEQQRDYTKRTPREKAYQAIDTERTYQDTKYGPIGDFHLSISGWEAVLKKHMAKLERETDATAALHIIRKLAGICVACMEQHGVPLCEPPALTSS